MTHEARNDLDRLICVVKQLKGDGLIAFTLNTMDSHRSLAPSVGRLFLARTNALQSFKGLHNRVPAGISVMFLNFRCILVKESIQDIRGFAHSTVNDINPVLFASVIHMVVECDPTPSDKKTLIPSEEEVFPSPKRGVSARVP